jgi:hypothetical protein
MGGTIFAADILGDVGTVGGGGGAGREQASAIAAPATSINIMRSVPVILFIVECCDLSIIIGILSQ